MLGNWIGNLAADGVSFWLPRQASNFASDVDANWDLVFWVSTFFFVLVVFLMFFFIYRFRGRHGDVAQSQVTHNTPLEVFWTVVPTLIVVVLFWQGYKTFLDMVTPPANTYEILAVGQKWNWAFTYPNGYVDSDLHVPVDTPVQLVLSSQDVMHAFYVPEFRVKRDVVPGRYNKIWFTATELGEYDIFCAEYCGTSHSEMLSKLTVQTRGEYDLWLEKASDFLSRMPPAEAGELLYNKRGCKQCHSLDGAAGIGPTFAGKWGSVEVLTTGESVPVEENYVRESIYEPQAKLVAGYEPVMPTYRGRLKEEEVSAIIEFLKTLSK